MKKTLSIIFVLLAVFSSFIPTAVFASEPHVYSVKYIPEKDEWRVQQLSSWDSSKENENMDYLWGNLQDGDSLVILGDENSPAFGDLKIDKKLANLTLFAVTSSIVVYANQNISEIYVLKGTVASLNGSYDTVYVYDNSSCNINSDVKKLQISGVTSMKMNVTALGKVDFCQIDYRGNVIATMYNVAPGTLKVVDGELKTDESHYSPYDPNGNGQIEPAPVGEEPESEYGFWDKIINFFKNIWSFITIIIHIKVIDFFKPFSPLML